MAKVSVFGAATRKQTSKPVPQANVIVAEDVSDPVSGQVIYTKAKISDAITNYVKGHEMEENGKALKSTCRPIVGLFARRNYARLWANIGQRPKSPKLTTDSTGDGTFITAMFVDKEATLKEEQYAQLVSCIGNKQAEENVIRRDEFSLNPEKLVLPTGREVEELDENGEAIKQEDGTPKMRPETVKDRVEAALGVAFENQPELLDGLMIVKPVFKTKKGFA